MSQQHIFNLWKEAPSSRPLSSDAFNKSMYLGKLRDAHRQTHSEQLFVTQYQIQDFVLCESKGRLRDATSLALPCPAQNTLWLCLQFQGTTVFPSGRATETDSLCSFRTMDGEMGLTLSAGRHWALFLGLSSASKQQLLSELPALRDYFDELQQDILPDVPIYHTERRTLETFSKRTFGPFSTLHHIGNLFLGLYSNYVYRFTNHLQQPSEEPNIQIYHRAVAYIRDNYLEKALNRETIAKALRCSSRSLSRAFEGRPLSLNGTILTIRLYKGREILIQRPDLTVEQIALMLHFFDSSHFITQYKKEFHRTPRQERQMLEPRGSIASKT